MDTLWGKYHTCRITLLEHTQHVVNAVDALFRDGDGPSRLGECWLRFFKLLPSDWERFYWNLLAAALLHDWGKANDGMQRVLTGTGSQAIRHEHFSALLIGLPAVMTWLGGNKQLDVPFVLSAVLTHHLKAGARADDWASATTGTVVRLQDRNGQFAELVAFTGSRLGLPPFDMSAIPERWVVGRQPADIRAHRTYIQDRVLAPIRRMPLDARRMLLAVRAGLIAADAAGSGFVRVEEPIEATVWKQFVARQPWTGGAIWTKIIKKRIAYLNEQFRKQQPPKPPFEWEEFQIACDTLPRGCLLLASCGSGKTLGAWRWIAAQACRQPVGRVLFLYPTRATAKEGFRDYVSWAPEADAALMHGNAAFDLNGMFTNESDPRHGRDYEADRRLFALGYWSRRVFSATVDQFLGFMQHGYGPLCMLPVLADSVIVVDEVHSFDRHMFTALKGFLKSFDVPVLCMTATLPADRKEALRESGLEVYEDRPGKLQTIADTARYTLTRVGSREDAFGPVADALTAGRRVLWVTNTVRRCHQVVARFAKEYARLRTADGKPVYCYHSRFKLTDRVKRHEDIVRALKVGQPAALGVTTQVCEMSLDLDVDLLVTEECPVTSLIQRMGRCNRDRTARPLAEAGQVIVYRPDDPAPYTADDLKGLEEFLGKTAGRELSQSVLECTLNGLTEIPPWLGDNPIMFLESGPYAVAPKTDDEDATTFREGTDYNRPCVLSNEVDAYNAAEAKNKPGFIVPVPKKLACGRDDANEPSHARLPRHLGVAVDQHYHEAVGFCDRPLTEWGAD